MTHHHLHRDDAPFGESVWAEIDKAVQCAASARLSVRRLLPIAGPLGFGVKTLPVGDRQVPLENDGQATVTLDPAVTLPLISSTFDIPARDISAFEQHGYPMNLKPAMDAAVACAAMEDRLLLEGAPAHGVPGLLSAAGIPSVDLEDWTKAGDAVANILAAVEKLDDTGHHGPYTLALEPSRYSALFKRYQEAEMLEIAHVEKILGNDVVKAPALTSGGVLLDVGSRCGAIVIGQDLMTGFEGPSGTDYTFVVSESLTLRLLDTSAVCRLRAPLDADS